MKRIAFLNVGIFLFSATLWGSATNEEEKPRRRSLPAGISVLDLSLLAGSSDENLAGTSSSQGGTASQDSECCALIWTLRPFHALDLAMRPEPEPSSQKREYLNFCKTSNLKEQLYDIQSRYQIIIHSLMKQNQLAQYEIARLRQALFEREYSSHSEDLYSPRSGSDSDTSCGSPRSPLTSPRGESSSRPKVSVLSPRKRVPPILSGSAIPVSPLSLNDMATTLSPRSAVFPGSSSTRTTPARRRSISSPRTNNPNSPLKSPLSTSAEVLPKEAS